MKSILEFLVKKHQADSIKKIKSAKDILTNDYFACEWHLANSNNDDLLRIIYGKCQLNNGDDIDMYFKIRERYTNGVPLFSEKYPDKWLINGDDFVGISDSREFRSVTQEEYEALYEIDAYLKKNNLYENIPSRIGYIDKDKKITFGEEYK